MTDPRQSSIAFNERETIVVEMALDQLSVRGFEPWAGVAKALRPRVTAELQRNWPENFSGEPKRRKVYGGSDA